MDKQQRQKFQSFLANRFLVSKSEMRRRLRADGLTKEQIDNIMKPIRGERVMPDAIDELEVFRKELLNKMITDNIYNKSPIKVWADIAIESRGLEESNDLDDQLEKLNKQTKNLNGILNQEEK